MSSLGAAVSLTMAVLTTSICSAFLLRESCVYVHALCNCRCVDRERAMVKKTHLRLQLLDRTGKMRMDQSFQNVKTAKQKKI